jgi:hypothetical protein
MKGASMSHEQLLVVLIILVAAAVVGFLVMRKRRSDQLRARFGPEYDRVVRQAGGVRQAEGVLEMRQNRLEKLAIHPLTSAQQADFAARWDEVQSQFVDDPKRAVTAADRLVGSVMQARGYPVSDFEQRAADISVDHPVVVDHYRAAHSIAVRHDRGQATTEDLRKAMVHYRTLFHELLGRQPVPTELQREKELQRKEA